MEYSTQVTISWELLRMLELILAIKVQQGRQITIDDVIKAYCGERLTRQTVCRINQNEYQHPYQ
jgi:hypothetical protein